MIAAALAYKSVLVPLLVGVLAWWHGRYARAAADGQAKTSNAEQKLNQTGDATDLDELP